MMLIHPAVAQVAADLLISITFSTAVAIGAAQAQRRIERFWEGKRQEEGASLDEFIPDAEPQKNETVSDIADRAMRR